MTEGRGDYGTADVTGGTSGALTNNLDDLITSAIKGEAEKRGVSYEETAGESAKSVDADMVLLSDVPFFSWT